MIRRLLLFFVCIGVIGLSSCNDDNSEIPVCNGEHPSETFWDLSNMGIEIIDRPIVTSSAMKCLNLAKNRITNISSNAFDGLPELRYLNLSVNPVERNNVTSNAKLETLILDGISPDNPERHWIRTYRNKWFLPELKKLSMRNNKYSYTSYNLYKPVFDVPKLTHLYLTGTNLTTIKFIDNLYEINNLTHLYLGNADVRSDTLNGLWAQNLQYLSMDNAIKSNPIFSETLPRGMYNLEYLSIMGNRYVSVDLNAFDDFGKLRVLNLAGNLISKFPIDSFHNLTSLKNFTLDDNRLTNVPKICDLKELEFLSLNDNIILSIDKRSFCNLTHLASIHLSMNSLTTIAEETFGHLPALVVLDLSDNNIVSLPEYWISPRNFITELNLEDNRFSDIQSMSLKNINGLESLSIGKNPIERISVLLLINLPNSTMIDTCWKP